MGNCQSGEIARLIEAARQGHPEDLATLLQGYSSYLTLLARSQFPIRFQGRFSVSDVVQEAFLRASERFGEFRGSTESEFLGWLRQILASRLVSMARHHLAQRRDVRTELRITTTVESSAMTLNQWRTALADTPSGHASRREQGAMLAQVLDQMPVDYREVLVMRHFEGKSFSEIAQLMQRTVASVKSMWTRAVIKLRQRLAEEEAR